MRLQDHQHYLLLVWLVITGLIVFGITVAWHEGLVMQLVHGDRSRICLAIGLLYTVASIHCAARVWYLSQQLVHASDVAELLANKHNDSTLTRTEHGLSLGDGVALPDAAITDHLIDLLDSDNGQAMQSGDGETASQERSQLAELLAERLKGAHELGWFVVDILLKLGLVGTIIGFIFMLGSVADTASLDVNTMQKVLRQMSSGMGTALFTTLAGLLGSILLGLQYLLLDKGADELLHRILHVAEIKLRPKLRPSSQP